jgi:FtsH-binding integral membrane protein
MRDLQSSIMRTVHSRAEVDQGLRAYMTQVFLYMALGLGLTGLIAFGVSSSPELMIRIHHSGLSTLLMFAPLGIAIFLGFGINRISADTAQILYWSYASLLGLSLSYLFVLYQGESIARIFFITASVFGGMSLYGYTTRRDLTNLGSFMMMGLLGLVVASLINWFLQSSVTQFILSILGVVIFTGLTAYDVQQIQQIYYESVSTEDAKKKAILGALTLYLDFINIFLRLLYLFGDRK